jgi:hypothetical protein
MSKYGLGLASFARLRRRQLILFAILSAIINGIVTAGVGAWLAQTYATYQRKTLAIQTISDLVYERRTRAGMVVWAVRRNAELDELRFRKRAYDEAFVAWNTKVQRNIFMIREISSEPGVTRLETQFQELLVAALADTDRCLTKAYDARLKGEDGTPILEACRMTDLHQVTLDCAATFTNELNRLTQLSFLPFAGPNDEKRKLAEARIDRGCLRPPPPLVMPKSDPTGPDLSKTDPSAKAPPSAAPALVAPTLVVPDAQPSPAPK